MTPASLFRTTTIMIRILRTSATFVLLPLALVLATIGQTSAMTVTGAGVEVSDPPTNTYRNVRFVWAAQGAVNEGILGHAIELTRPDGTVTVSNGFAAGQRGVEIQATQIGVYAGTITIFYNVSTDIVVNTSTTDSQAVTLQNLLAISNATGQLLEDDSRRYARLDATVAGAFGARSFAWTCTSAPPNVVPGSVSIAAHSPPNQFSNTDEHEVDLPLPGAYTFELSVNDAYGQGPRTQTVVVDASQTLTATVTGDLGEVDINASDSYRFAAISVAMTGANGMRYVHVACTGGTPPSYYEGTEVDAFNTYLANLTSGALWGRFEYPRATTYQPSANPAQTADRFPTEAQRDQVDWKVYLNHPGTYTFDVTVSDAYGEQVTETVTVDMASNLNATVVGQLGEIDGNADNSNRFADIVVNLNGANGTRYVQLLCTGGTPASSGSTADAATFNAYVANLVSGALYGNFIFPRSSTYQPTYSTTQTADRSPGEPWADQVDWKVYLAYPGVYDFKVIATDAYGERSIKTVSVDMASNLSATVMSHLIETQPPGTSERFADIRVAIANANGNRSVTLTLQDALPSPERTWTPAELADFSSWVTAMKSGTQYANFIFPRSTTYQPWYSSTQTADRIPGEYWTNEVQWTVSLAYPGIYTFKVVTSDQYGERTETTTTVGAGQPTDDGADGDNPTCANPNSAPGSNGGSVVGGSSPGSSRIYNVEGSHFHDAVDWAVSGPSGCVPCGASGPSVGGSDLPSLRLGRIHRYRDQDRAGSFGPGIFLTYDVRLSLDPGSLTASLWDPSNRFAYELSDAGTTGTYVDAKHGTVAGLALFDATDTATTDQAAATTAVLTVHDGRRYRFELFTLDPVAPAQSYAGRLVAIEDRNGNAQTLTYVDPDPTVDTVTLGGDRNKLWRMASITDAYGRQATMTWLRHVGQWVVDRITTPSGVIRYRYGTSTLVGLNRIEYPDGSMATFSTAWDPATFSQSVAMDDAGAEGIHRRKTLALAPALLTRPGFTLTASLQPNQVRRVTNGAGELGYRRWIRTTSATNVAVLVYEGGGETGGGSLLRLDTDDGIPTATWRATSFDLSAAYETYTWELVASYQHDGLTRVTDRSTPDGRTTSWVHTAAGAPATTRVMNRDGSVYMTTEQLWSPFRQPTATVDGLNRQTLQSYDATGNQLTRTEGAGSAVASTTSWTWNGRGQPLTMTDPNGNVTDYAYDAQGYLISVTEPPDVPGGPRAVRTIAYDPVGRVIANTDPAGREVSYAYDSRNRLLTTTYADGSTGTITYATGGPDANLPLAETDRNGNVATVQYDGAGRVIARTSAAGAPEAVTDTYAYLPGKQLVVSQTSRGETTGYAYDRQFRQVGETQQPRQGVSLTSSTTYGSDQRVWAMTDPYGRRIFPVFDTAGHQVRTIRELIPGAVIGIPTGSAAAREAYLLGLARIQTSNPPYVIEDAIIDVEGQLVARIDGRGIRSTMAYDAQGRLIEQVAAEAFVDAAGVATLLAPPEAALTRYAYDAAGNRVAEILPRSFTRSLAEGTWSAGTTGDFRTTWAWTGRNRQATETVADGLDALGQVRPERATTNWSYTLTGQIATVTDPLNRTTVNTYGACCDRLVAVTDPAGFTATIGYDHHSNRTSATDPNGTTTAWTYDGLHRPVTMTNGAGETSVYVYDDDLSDGLGLDAAGSPLLAHLVGIGLGAGSDFGAVAVTNPAGESTAQIRDGLGRTVRSIDGLGHASTMVYDIVVGDLVRTNGIDALGHTVSQEADGHGLTRRMIDALGMVATLRFDANGNRVSVRDANGLGQDCVYDARDRDTACTDTRSDVVVTTTKAYDAHGNLVDATDALGAHTTCVVDARDRKIAATDRVNATTQYVYDLTGNLVRITDAEGGVTDYAYDVRDLLIGESFPVGQQGRTQKAYGYDPGRRLVSRTITTEPDSGFVETTSYAYDGANRLLGRGYDDGVADILGYDLASRLVSAESERYGNVVSRSFDSAGRLAEERLELGNGAISGGVVTGKAYTVGYQYDADNRLIQQTYPNGQVVTRSWTDRNQLDVVAWDGSLIADRGYDDGMRPVSSALGNGLVESRTYVPGSRLPATIQVPGVTAFAYSYDANGRKTAEADGVLPAYTQTFGYDAADRLTAWARPNAPGGNTQSWDLSPVGDWNQTLRNGTTETRTHSDVHELTGIALDGGASAPLGYDAKGNLAADDRGMLVTWDPENRLATAVVPSSASPTGFGLRATYTYDALGRRVTKTVHGQTTVFAHGGAQVLVEEDRPVIPSQAEVDGADGDGTAAHAALTPASGGILPGVGVLRVNVQPADTAIPAGFYADKGRVYGVRTHGLSYGWDSALSSSWLVARQGAVPLVEWDTHARMAPPAEAAGTWSLALPNGIYPVIIVCGDPLSTEQTNDLVVNGVTLIDPDPSALPGYTAGDFDGYALLVPVTDGMLTIAPAASAVDPKLCVVEIGPAGATLDPATRDRLEALVQQATDATWDPIGPVPVTAERAYVWGAYVDDLLAYTVGDGSTSTRYFTHTNHLFSVAAVTDATGAVVERQTYTAYGEPSVLNAAGTVTLTQSSASQSRGFTGYRLDRETGWYHARARPYAPALGRFPSRDPAGYVDGSSLYAGYFLPGGVDPSGKFVIFVHGIGDTQHRDKGPLVYTGMIESWRHRGRATQGFTHFLYGPAGKLDPMGEDTARNKAAAKALKEMVESIQKTRDKITPCPKDQEPIYIYAYSNGSIITKLALEMGMKVEGVVFSGAALDADTDLTRAKASTPWIFNYHSDEDGTNGWIDGAGRNGFANPPAGIHNISVPKVDHYIDDNLWTASDVGRVNGYTEWDSRHMGRIYGRLLYTTNNSLSTGMQYTYPDGTVRSARGYNLWESGVK